MDRLTATWQALGRNDTFIACVALQPDALDSFANGDIRIEIALVESRSPRGEDAKRCVLHNGIAHRGSH